MAEIQKESLRFVSEGMLLGIVNNINVRGKFNFLQNVRTYVEGIIESRPLLDDYLTLNPVPNAIPHTIKTILNKANNTINRLAGADTKLFSGSGTPLALKDTGYSGKPFFLVDFRPENSVEAYVYIADENKFKKLSVSDVLSDVGITAPSLPITWKIGAPNQKIIDKIEVGSDAAWNNLTGSAGAPSLQSRINTTILAFLADAAAPNYASIVPVAMTQDIQPGAIVTLNGADDVIITEVLPSTLNTSVATISKIVYDAGAAGLCTIVLSVSSKDIVRNSILYLNATEYVRVIDVTYDGNNIPSIRTSTTGTFAAGNSVSGVSSFRFYATNAYVATNTIIGQSIKSSIGATGVSSITRVFNVDLLNTGSGGKPLTLNDLFHASLLLSSITNLTEVQIQLDVDTTVNDFTKNYFYYSLSPNFFASSAAQTAPTLSVLQQAQQRTAILDQVQQRAQLLNHILRNNENSVYPIDPFDPAYGIIGDGSIVETSLGALQWTEVNIKLADFKRVGADDSRTLKDVKAIRISVNCTAALDFYIDSLWVGGADALDNSQQGFLPYNYVARVRDPATRVFSNWSPPLRQGIKITRGRTELSFPEVNANYPNTYKIDIARFGGNLSDFRILGSLKNDGSTYTDLSSDKIVSDNQLAGRFANANSANAVFDFYKPFALIDTPKKGVCSVVGTTLTWVSGDILNTTYPRGVLIVVNGIANTFYSNPSDIHHVELEIDMGSLTNVVFEIEEPLLTGQVLPVIFGPFGEGIAGLYIYGLGDKNAAGTLYWLDGNSPDTMSDLNRLEITSPSEPLVAGVMWDGYGQVFSTGRSFTILPTQSADGSFGFIARENPGSRGVFSRWGIDVGPTHIYFLSENADGLYRQQGNSAPECITNAGFDNLFYKNGKAPTLTVLVDGTIIYPPDYTAITDIRLFCTNDFLNFRFKDTNGSHVVLVLDCKTNNIVSYDTFPNNQINAIYREETEAGVNVLAGTQNAIKKFISGPSTFESAMGSKIIPFALDAGDSRIEKLFEEEVIWANQGTNGFLVTNYFNNGNVVDATVNIPGSITPRRQDFIIEIGLGKGFEYQNITSVYLWNASSGNKFYEQIVYYYPQADRITDRAGDLFQQGDGKYHLWTGVTFRAQTYNAVKAIDFYDDLAALKASILIQHNGRTTKVYKFPTPFVSKTIRRTSNDDVSWVTYLENYELDEKAVIPDIIDDAIGDTFLGDGTLRLWRGVVIGANTFGINKTLNFYDEDNVLKHTQIINHNGYSVKAYNFIVDFISHSVRVAATDGVIWAKYFLKYEYDPDAIIYEGWQNKLGTVYGTEISPLRLWEGVTMEANAFNSILPLTYYDDSHNLKHTENTEFVGRLTETFQFNYPFISRTVTRLVDNAFIRWIFYKEKFKYDEAITIPEFWENRIGLVDNGRTAGAKLWQGLILEANTLGQNKTLKFYDDQRVLRHTEVINCNNRKTVTIAFPTPFISHTVRMVADDDILWGYYTKEYVYDIEPEAAKVWEGEFYTSSFATFISRVVSGLIVVKRLAIGYRTLADTTFTMTFHDGTTQVFTLPNSNGDWHKEFFYVAAKKTKGIKYRFESAQDFRLYKSHCEMWMKSYNAPSPSSREQYPFGGESNSSDMTI